MRISSKEIPLVCPFCDELAYVKQFARRKALPDRIYTLRECVMGHQFWSVETVPENQAEIVNEIREFAPEIKEWMRDVRESGTAKERPQQSDL